MVNHIFTALVLLLVIEVVTFAQRQYFQVRPTNVTVSQGDTATMQCTVGNQAQQGHTHWTKDGAALGFEDSLPGWPRYEIVGNHAHGEYHLEISQAAIEDDAEYECQVQPAEGEDNGLRAKAYLNVIVPPNNVTLENVRNGAIIEIKADSTAEVSCRVSGAKPAADIRWYKNGTPIPERLFENRYVAEDDKRYATISRLRWTASKDDNGVVFTCDVVHEAVLASRSLKTQFTLSVLYPPGIPSISGYDSNRTLISDDYLQLRCTVENGNPPPDLVWYRNSIPVGRNATAIQRFTRNDYGFIVKAIDDEVDYRCEASNLATITPLSSSIRLKVYFPPEKVDISGPDEATVGSTIRFECKSSASRPQAKIEWLIDGHAWPDHTQENKASTLRTGIESFSFLEIKVTQTRPEMIVICTSINEHLPRTSKREATAKKTVKVYYAPESVKISYNNDKPLRSGETVLLTCAATGGYPAATLEWFRNEKRVTNGATSKHGASNSAISELTLPLSPQSNLEQIQCRAYNLASGSDRLADTIALHVHFPPTSVRIMPDPAEFRAGTAAELTCDSSSANPSPTVEWYRDGELSASIVAHNKTGSYGGWVIRKKLFLSPTVEDNGAVYECRAWSETLKSDVVSAKIALSVQYRPSFFSSVTHTLDVLEGESISLNASANANPPVEQYMWFKDDLSYILRSNAPNMIVNGPVLEFVNTRRTDAGTYTCRARNYVGTSNMTAIITVKYAPEIKYISSHTYATPGDNVTLNCEVDAHPIDSLIMKWENRNGDRLGPTNRFLEISKKNQAVLTIYGIRENDTAEYVCKADNGIGIGTKRTAVLVKQSPHFDNNATTNRAAAAIGGEVKLKCAVIGVPSVSMNWLRDGEDESGIRSVVRLSADHRIRISHYNDGLARYTSDLNIKDIEETDYGTYHCVADNELGTRSIDIKFGTPDIPEPPHDVRILNSTHNAVTLSWKFGFDGGLNQRFRVRYSIGGSERPYDSPQVFFDNGMATIYNLQPSTKYTFFVDALNEKGFSSFAKSESMETATVNIIRAYVEEEIPILIIILVCLVGVLLLVLNAALVVCFIRRHRKKKLQEKATNARLGTEPRGGRKIQMYSSDVATGTMATGTEGDNRSTAATKRADSQYGNISDNEQYQRPQSAISDDDNSIRTVIEVENTSQPLFNRADATMLISHGMEENDMDDAFIAAEYEGNVLYDDRMHSNSLQRQHISNGLYSVPTTSGYTNQARNHYATAQVPEELLPPTTGPLRSISQELNNYAAYSHYRPLPSSSPSTRHTGHRKYSPPQPGQMNAIPTVVHTNGRTPYAEVRPILTTASHIQSPLVSNQCHSINADRNGGSPVLSTFASSTIRHTKSDYSDMDGIAGDLV